jgi:choline dehydrogenase-like flavoprotein
MRELRVPILKDSMGGNSAGAFWFLLSLNPKDETRSTSENFYTPSRPNLHLLIGTQVTKIVFRSGDSKVIATGIEFSTGESGNKKQVTATKEVILAAGALHTPQILQLSGIGDAIHLSSLEIKTVVDLSGVGQNYQDHPLLVTVQSGRIFWSCFRCTVLIYRPNSVDLPIQTANFSNSTWNSQMRALYDERREG